MDPSAPKPARRSTLAVDAALTLLVFALFTWVLRDHVPSNDPVNMWVWGAVGASCLTAVFWLALQMGRAVFNLQRSERKK